MKHLITIFLLLSLTIFVFSPINAQVNDPHNNPSQSKAITVSSTTTPSGTTIDPTTVGANLGKAGVTFSYSNSSWPSCVNWGIPTTVASMNLDNAVTPPTTNCTFENLTYDASNTETNLANGKACFIGTDSYYCMHPTSFGYAGCNVRMRIVVTKSDGTTALPLTKVGNYILVQSDENFKAKVYIEVNTANLSNCGWVTNLYNTGWRGAVTVYDALSTSPSHSVCTQFDHRWYNVSSSASASSSTENTCIGGTILLSGTSDFGSSYINWSGPNSYTSTAQNPTVTTNAQSSHQGIYTLQINNGSVCYGEDEVSITVHPNNTWTGNTSTNWNTSSNWQYGIPDIEQSIVIDNAASNQPVISGSSSGDCNNITVESGASLTIQSDGSFITNGTTTNNGVMIAQRFIPGSTVDAGDYTWHSISLPVATTNAGIYFTGDYMYSYNETTDVWDNIVPTTTTIERGTGYIIKTINGSKTYNFTGTLNNGSFNYNLTRNGGGYNFVGNPYPSYLDLEAISRTNLGATIYVWDPTNTNWATYQIGSGAGSLGRYLHPMQGFFIQANSGGGSIGFANNDRTHNSSGNFLKDGEIEINKLTLNASGNDLTDQLFIQEHNQENDGYEMYSMNPDVPHLFVQDNAEEFCIFNMHSEPGYSCLPLGFWCAINGDYTISIAENNFEGYNLIIEDLLEETLTPISVNETFEFSYTAGSNKDRFCLHFMYLSDIETENILNYIVVGKENGIIVKTFGEQTNIEVFDINGRLLSKTTSNGNESFIPVSTSGLYIVKLQSKNNTEVRKVVVN